MAKTLIVALVLVSHLVGSTWAVTDGLPQQKFPDHVNQPLVDQLTEKISSQAQADAPTNLSTPQLIEAAFTSGKIDQDTANLYLAYALGDYEKLPALYHSNVPWDGTLPLHHLQETVRTMKPGPIRTEISEMLTGSCGNSNSALPNTHNTTHFHIEYDTIGGGLGINDYASSLEITWNTEITNFGWAAPPVLNNNPPPGNRYHVRIDNLGGGLYGYVSTSGDHAGLVGNNPNTSWDEEDAYATCMVLNRDYSDFPGSSRQALEATAAHEFNHSIQFGYGAITGANRPDESFVEGGATWMEDEVFDSANDNYNYLWPDFDKCMGEYTASPYPFWITFRGLTERYGTGTSGGAEQVMQDFWEETSKSSTSNMLDAMNTALINKGTTLADAYHAYAIAVKFNKTCGGGYVYPYCFEEGANYVSNAGETLVHGTIATVGDSYTGSVADGYALNWLSLPTGDVPYNVTLENTSNGGQLRGSVVCDTGTALNVNFLPTVVSAGNASTLTNFDPTNCTSVVAVITNQSQRDGNPASCTDHSYQLSIEETLRIAVTPPDYDDIGAVLTKMGYPWTQITDADLTDYSNISSYDVIFANCSSAALSNGQAAQNALQQFIQNGGSFYASDWAYSYIEAAFPSYINFAASDPRIGGSQWVNASITDSGIANYLDPGNPPTSIDLEYDLGGWVVIDSTSGNTTTYLRGSFNTSQGWFDNKPLLVSFRPYGPSGGRVIYTTFHNEPQQTEIEEKLLEYLVLLPTTTAAQQQVQAAIEAEDLVVAQLDINTIDPGQTSPKVAFNNQKHSTLLFALGWGGSRLRLTVYQPDGSIFQSKESPASPISILVPDAEPGQWKYQVTAISVPYNNYPYVVGIGVVPFQVYLPLVTKTYGAPSTPTWTPGSGITDRAVYGLAVAPGDCNTVYAATDAGLYRSTNGGASWSPTGLNTLLTADQPQPQAPPFAKAEPGATTATIIAAVAADPANGQIVYAATWGNGIYKSTNGGATWFAVNNGLGDEKWFYAITVAPTNSQVLYAGGNSSGVFKSTDGGGSWTAVNSGLGDLSVRSLTVDPTNPQTVYAGVQSGSVYKSGNGGASWSATGGLGGGAPWAILVDPTNGQTVYAALGGGGVYKSTNGGASWFAVNSGLGGLDLRALIFDPANSQTLYAGASAPNGGGVYRTTNGGGSWSAMNDGLSADAQNVKALHQGAGCGIIHAGTTDGAWRYGP